MRIIGVHKPQLPTMSTHPDVRINQSVAILIDGNNIERGLQKLAKDDNALLDFDKMVPKLLQERGLKRLIYFREGISISDKLAQRLLTNFHGSVVPCHKSADIPLTIMATQIAQKVDTIIILSGDSDYVELVRHLKGEGVRVEIAAVQHATAKILVDEVEHFTPITLEDCYILKAGRASSKSRSTSTKRTTKAKTTSKPTADKPKAKAKPQKAVKPAAKKASDSTPVKEAQKRKPARRKPAASKGKAPTAEQKENKKPTSKRTSTKRRPAAKSIKEIEKEKSSKAKKPVVQKMDDWDDLSF